jgi:hypothetical protein
MSDDIDKVLPQYSTVESAYSSGEDIKYSKVNIYGILGRGEKLLVADTHTPEEFTLSSSDILYD